MHLCHARDCREVIPPKMLMCSRHWYMVPRHIQRAVWAAYVTGQEIRKDPTPAYLRAMDAAINSVADREASK